MDHFARIDVSLEQSSVFMVDAASKIMREAKVASEPDALVGFFSEPADAQEMRALLVDRKQVR